MNGIQKGIKIGAICLAIVIIVNIFGALLYGLSFFINIDYNDSKEENTTNYEEKYNNVQIINIDSKWSNITIKPGTEFKVEAANVQDDFTSKITGNTLKIKENKSLLKGLHLKRGKVTIYVPNNYTLDTLIVKNGAGEIVIDNISAENLSVNQGAGTITIKNSNFQNTNLNGGAGKMEIFSSQLNNLDLDSGAGSISIEATLLGNSKIDCGAGRIDLVILGKKEEYLLNIEKGIGSIRIDKEEQKNNVVYGNGNNILKIDGGVGAIEVTFNED